MMKIQLRTVNTQNVQKRVVAPSRLAMTVIAYRNSMKTARAAVTAARVKKLIASILN
jgi:hypothetical protein